MTINGTKLKSVIEKIHNTVKPVQNVPPWE